MKLGIFGDSFARSNHFPGNFNTTLPWYEILKDRFEISNHGLLGTSFYYSYIQFEKYHSNYDRVVLMVTAPGRIWLPERSRHYRDQGLVYEYEFISGIFSVDEMISRPEVQSDPKLLTICTTAKNYFLHIQNDEFESFTQVLMIDKLKKLRPDIVLVPCFPHSMGGYGVGLSDIASMENESCGMSQLEMLNKKYVESKHCHLSEENNMILAKKMLHWLNGEPVSIVLDDYVKNPKDMLRYYSKMDEQ